MSYSFSVTALTKDEAKQKVAEQFAYVVNNQPCHAVDKDAALTVANAFIDLLSDVTDGHEINVSMNGCSLRWNHNAPDKYVAAGVNVSAGIRARTA
jgi:hypothetical protein